MSILKKIFKAPNEENPFLEEIDELETLLHEKDKKIQILEIEMQDYKSKTVVDEKMLFRLEGQLKNQKDEIDILKRKNDMLLKGEGDAQNSFKDELSKVKELNEVLSEEKKRLEDRFKKVCLELESAKKNRIDEQTVRNLKTVSEELALIKQKNAKLKKENEEKNNRITYLESSFGFAAFDLKDAKYRLMIKDLYEARKYDDFKKACIGSQISYVDELDSLDFGGFALENDISEVKRDNARSVYEDYKAGKISSEHQEYLVKGHTASKVFFRFRSFVKYLDENSIVHMSQLDKFDFNGLKETGEFTGSQVKKFIKKYNEYNQLRKIK